MSAPCPQPAAKRTAWNARAIVPYNRPAALGKLDQRTKEARLMREAHAELVAHVGGNPSATQSALIDQAVQIKLRLAVMDRKFAESHAQTDHDSRQYLAWANSFTRLLRQLGLKGAPERAPDLASYLASRAPTPAPAGTPVVLVPSPAPRHGDQHDATPPRLAAADAS